jgi:hypothetical protein
MAVKNGSEVATRSGRCGWAKHKALGLLGFVSADQSAATAEHAFSAMEDNDKQ